MADETFVKENGKIYRVTKTEVTPADIYNFEKQIEDAESRIAQDRARLQTIKSKDEE